MAFVAKPVGGRGGRNSAVGFRFPRRGVLLGKNKNQKFVVKKSNLKSTEIQIS